MRQIQFGQMSKEGMANGWVHKQYIVQLFCNLLVFIFVASLHTLTGWDGVGARRIWRLMECMLSTNYPVLRFALTPLIFISSLGGVWVVHGQRLLRFFKVSIVYLLLLKGSRRKNQYNKNGLGHGRGVVGQRLEETSETIFLRVLLVAVQIVKKKKKESTYCIYKFTDHSPFPYPWIEISEFLFTPPSFSLSY